MQVQVRKVSRSLGVILPAEVLDALHAKEGATLELVPNKDGDGYLLRVSDAEFEKQMRIARSLISRYGRSLRALSK